MGCNSWSSRELVPLDDAGVPFDTAYLPLDAGTGTTPSPTPDPDPVVPEPTPTPAPTESFAIDFVFSEPVSAAQRAVFELAASRWEHVILADVPDRYVRADSCGVPASLGALTVDDLLVVVDVQDIDGAGGALAAAGPRCIRGDEFSEGRYLPITARMVIDRDDLTRLFEDARLLPVVTHELGHALGFGTGWDELELLRDPSCSEEGCEEGHDTLYRGVRGRRMWRDLGGTGFVPVEASAVRGSADTHWSESVFMDELMTPRIPFDATDLPLSSLTIGALEDLGYEVDTECGDAYLLPDAPGAAAHHHFDGEELGDDVLRGPIELI